MGGYQIEIDDKIYSFSNYSTIFSSDCNLSVFDKSQKITSGKYTGIISGKPISKYNFSKSLWKQLEKLYKKQENIKYKNQNDLEYLSDINRNSKKYNI